MQEYLQVMAETQLFKGFNQSEIQSALGCLHGKVKCFTNKSMIIQQTDEIKSVGIILEGSILLTKTNIEGRRQIYSERHASELICEHCLWSNNTRMFFDVEGVDEGVILFIDKDKIVNPNMTTCELRQRIIENLFQLLLINNQSLYQKIELVSQQKLRERILHYLTLQSQKNNAANFFIPFSRDELADYLGADRSALSRELSKLKTEGFIDYKKNYFELK